jgi:hypothetical protein
MKRYARKKKSVPQKGGSGSFPIINNNAAGIDIGSEEHWVAVPDDRDENPVRPFGCFTSDLHAMARWLKECGVATVAMESTGVYWIPPFQILEEHGLEVKLAMPAMSRTCPDARAMSQIANGCSVSIPTGSCPAPSALTIRYAFSVHTGGAGRTLSATPPIISSTYRRPSPR